MALQLRNKAKEENQNSTKKTNGKYKRKRNVFGKRLFRFGLVATIAALAIAFAIVKTVFTLSQNAKQNKIDQDLIDVNNKISEYRTQLGNTGDDFQNVGELIATLPVNFDRQATSLDLDRIVILSGLTESTTNTRTIKEAEKIPFDCTKTIKAYEISMTLYGTLDDITSINKFIDLLCDYKHENFYYIKDLSFGMDRTIYYRSEVYITFYTFYNEVQLNPTTQTTTTK